MPMQAPIAASASNICNLRIFISPERQRPA
jgi:hypothetical protein